MTNIFNSFSEFSNRSNKKENGVSPEFALVNVDFKYQNDDNEGCWNCSRCSGCSGCSDCSDCSDCSGCSRCSRCSDCSGCSGCSDCSRCSGCSGCSDCSRCSDCSGCSDCSRCSRCSDLKNAIPVAQENNSDAGFKVPIIENIHQKILEAVSGENAFDMSTYHACETTHCRFGWAIHLAGKEGYELAKKTDSLFAGMQIFHKSSPIRVAPTRAFESNEVALADIIRCAEEEKKLTVS